MKIIDVFSLEIPDDLMPGFARAHDLEYPGSIIVSDEDTALGWVKYLVENTVFDKLQIVCDENAFPFWGRVPTMIEVISFAGKKMPKSFRSDDDKTWIVRTVTGARTKTQIKNQAENPEHVLAILARTQHWQQIKPVDTDLGKVDGDYILVTEDNFDEVVADLNGNIVLEGTYIAWDTETENAGEDDTGAPNPYTAEMVGCSISTHAGSGAYFPVGHRDPATDEPIPGNLDKDRVLATLVALLRAALPDRRITHNGKYDHSVIAAPAQGVDIDLVYSLLEGSHDTMLMASVANKFRAALKYLAETELGATVMDFKKLTQGKAFAYVPLDAATIYACQDADWTGQLFSILKQDLEDLDLWHIYEEIELPIIEYFMRMERNGFLVDREQFEDLAEQFAREVERMRNLFVSVARKRGLHVPDDFNISSGQQVAKILFDPAPAGLGLPILSRTKDGTPSTDKKHFNALIAKGINPPLMQLLRKVRDITKLKSSYVDPTLDRHIQGDDRVRASFHQLGAATGRTSATDPAVQTLPGSLRLAFIPESHPVSGDLVRGELASLDYSQVELRVMAAVSAEPRMLQAFRDWKDIHAATQADVGLRSRTLAKNFNFGVGFGAGPPTLSETAGIPLAEAEAFYDQYWETYTTLHAYLFDLQIPRVADLGYAETWAGRKRLVDAATTIWEKASLGRLAMNTPVQGGALDIMKIAMQRVKPLLPEMARWNIYPVNMVHDELDFERYPETPPDVFRAFMNKVRDRMESANPWPDLIPMPVDITYGRNWAECK